MSFWKRQQLQYAADHQGQIEIPNYEIYSNKENSKGEVDHLKAQTDKSHDFENISLSLDQTSFISQPRSISLSNNGSRISEQRDMGDGFNEFGQNNVKYVPIVLLCCPNVIKGKNCGCGYNSYYPVNQFDKQQIQKNIGIIGQNIHDGYIGSG